MYEKKTDLGHIEEGVARCREEARSKEEAGAMRRKEQ